MAVQVPGAYYFSASGLLILWSLIVIRGFRERMIGKYRLFYLYVAVCATAYLIRLTTAHFLGAEAYSLVYFWTNLGQALLAAALLYQIFRLSDRPGSKSRWVISLAIPLIIFVQSAVSESYVYIRILNGVYCFIAVLGGINLTRLRYVALGRNYYAILGGVLFPGVLGALNHLAYFSRLPWWPRDLFVHLGDPIVWLAWLVMLFGMWRYDPPKPKNRNPSEAPLKTPRGSEVLP